VNKDQQTVPQQIQENTKTTGREEELGDFSTTFRVLPISGLAVVIGAFCAFVALALLRLIALFTNLFSACCVLALAVPSLGYSFPGATYGSYLQTANGAM